MWCSVPYLPVKSRSAAVTGVPSFQHSPSLRVMVHSSQASLATEDSARWLYLVPVSSMATRLGQTRFMMVAEFRSF